MIKKIKTNKIGITCFIVIVGIIVVNIFHYYNLVKETEELGEFDVLNLISHFSTWKYIMTSSYAQFLLIVAPILLATPAIERFYLEYRTGFFQNILFMKKYGTYIAETIIKSILKTSWWIPSVSIIVFLISYIMYPNSVVTNNNNEILYFSEAFLKYPLTGFFMSTINMFLLSTLIIFIGLLMVRYIRNFPLVILATFLGTICISVISDGFIGNIIATTSGDYYFANCFSVYNSWALATVDYIWLNTVYLFLLNIIVFIFVLKIYRSKEQVVLSYE